MTSETVRFGVRRRAASLLTALVLSACASVPPDNRSIETGAGFAPNDQWGIGAAGRSGELLLVTTFSGGGTRAAAFAYGVLEELAATRVPLGGEPRRLVDEIDVISSVSGGSFAASYFGLFGNRIFEDFERVFLRRDVQSGLIFELFRPVNWLRLFRIDRSQLAASYYDRMIFEGSTFADFRRTNAPQVVLNATDLSTAGRFPFSPVSFGLICSDLASFPVANAVTASSAVPIAFPPIRLRNHAGSCDFEPPGWLGRSTIVPAAMETVARDEIISSYSEDSGRDYIHLLDGGLSDNLGLRNAVVALSAAGDPRRAVREIGHSDIRNILVIVVNAESDAKHSWDSKDKAVSTTQVVSGLIGGQMHASNRITIELARELFSNLARDLSRPGAPVGVELVEVSFAAVEDPEERAYLGNIETSFKLSDDKVDHLIAAGRDLLRDSPGFQRALTGIRGTSHLE